MIEDAIAKLERIVGERAFEKGAAAYHAGHPRHAPAVFGVYSGWWVRGYDEAAMSNPRRDVEEWESA